MRRRSRAIPSTSNATESSRPAGEVDWLSIIGARHNNLKNVDVHFPLRRFVAVTGVSGSGKSSLVNDILREALAGALNGADTQPGLHDRIDGVDQLDKVIDIDQSPIGRTPRSNPATYIKLFDRIRDLYTKLPEAKARGYKAGRFSFNVSGGRCESCEGNGSNRLEMDFLADVWVPCPVCEGRRFLRETLQVRYREKNIADVLKMEVEQALTHFENLSDIHGMLKTLQDVGLEYLQLGQPSPTLSGGEAQRIKLARELCKRSTGRTLYILDEPTTGLHFADIEKLLRVLHQFVDAGNSVVVIEHNLDVIKTADWVIDLGPEGGAAGGRVVAEGTPEEVARHKESYTGAALASLLNPPKKNGRDAKGLSRPSSEPLTHLEVVGARQHNLRDVHLRVPLRLTTVFSGPSGSGKTSLAIDTLYAEGQRRYVESLSSYARQFLGQMQKPAVERVTGLSPAICIEQKSPSKNPRSTVGTVTEIYDYFRILMARLGQPYCPDCDAPIGTQTSEEIIDRLLHLPDGSKVHLLAPVQPREHADYESLWTELTQLGYLRVRVDGATHELSNPPSLSRRRKHEVQVVVDRVIIRHHQRGRIADSVQSALDLGKGVLLVAHVEDAVPEKKWTIDRYSQHFSCESCHTGFAELTPGMFSFNSVLGWCPRCEGLGVQLGGDQSTLFSISKRSIRDGLIAVWPSLESMNEFTRQGLARWSGHLGFDLQTPMSKLLGSSGTAIVRGTGEEWIDWGDGLRAQYKGLAPALDEASRVSWVYRHRLSNLVAETPCEECDGSRLRRYPAATRLKERTIKEWMELPLSAVHAALSKASFSAAEKRIAGEVLREVQQRLEFLIDVGLDYLTLARSTPSLSGGEAQRIRLASQLGSGLTGVLYLLDEPTIGLHPRDNGRLLRALKKLRDLGNTLIMVEHDREVIHSSDYLVDFGPGAGREGGTIVAQGSPSSLMKDPASLTGRYLSGDLAIGIPKSRRPIGTRHLSVINAHQHNLKGVSVDFPLGCFVAVTGVSGSGKSSLVLDVLWAALARQLHRAQVTVGLHESIEGMNQVDKVINVDQQPIGNTPSSNAATYTGIFDIVRDLYALLPESMAHGWGRSRFSFNRPGGRCEECEGSGQKKIEMHFLPDVWITCEACKGKRYTASTLSVTYKGRSIADVLEMTVRQALAFFENVPRLTRLLKTLDDVGLGYLSLGQAAPTLSGGEAQRVKLAAELARPSTGKTIYILDEPTTGLHLDDLRKLLDVLHRLVNMGNTVVVIEHQLDLIKTADWVIDIGPEAGAGGGSIVAVGTPEELVERERSRGDHQPISHTAVALGPVLAAGPWVDAEHAASPELPKAADRALRSSDLGDSAKPPWDVDGPRWHTIDRIAHNGSRCQWEGAALAWLIEQIEGAGKFSPTNWNHRSTVKIGAPGREHSFLTALTGEEWLLKLKFRVDAGAFMADALNRSLALAPVSEIREIPLYDSGPRVRIKPAIGNACQVIMSVYRLAEIQTPAFERFLKAAMASYLNPEQRLGTNSPKGHERPSGRHSSRQGFAHHKRIQWDLSIVEPILRCLEEATPGGRWEDQEASVIRCLEGSDERWAVLHTKEPEALRLVLFGPKRAFELERIDHLGCGRSIIKRFAQVDIVRLWFQSEDDFSSRALIEFLTDHADRTAMWRRTLEYAESSPDEE